MTVLEYYKQMQLNDEWFKTYSGSGDYGHQKVLPYTGTCFRNLESFFSQTIAIGSGIGKTRNECLEEINGRTDDPHKQRRVGLQKAKVIYDDQNNKTQYTLKADEIKRLGSLSNELNKYEKKLALMILLLDYGNGDDFEVVNKALEIHNRLFNAGIDSNVFVGTIRKAILVDEKEELFSKDAFWLVTFAYDNSFVTLYNNSTEDEKKELFEYVKLKSTEETPADLIAYKYRPGGSYSVSTFVDELRFILTIIILIIIKDNNFDYFFTTISKIYPNCESSKIISYIRENDSEYKKVYSNFINKVCRRDYNNER